jgi:hypothetical protein
VLFCQYESASKASVKADGTKVGVSFRDPVLGRELSVSADCVALSAGFIADDE